VAGLSSPKGREKKKRVESRSTERKDRKPLLPPDVADAATKKDVGLDLSKRRGKKKRGRREKRSKKQNGARENDIDYDPLSSKRRVRRKEG